MTIFARPGFYLCLLSLMRDTPHWDIEEAEALLTSSLSSSPQQVLTLNFRLIATDLLLDLNTIQYSNINQYFNIFPAKASQYDSVLSPIPSERDEQGSFIESNIFQFFNIFQYNSIFQYCRFSNSSNETKANTLSSLSAGEDLDGSDSLPEYHANYIKSGQPDLLSAAGSDSKSYNYSNRSDVTPCCHF